MELLPRTLRQYICSYSQNNAVRTTAIKHTIKHTIFIVYFVVCFIACFIVGVRTSTIKHTIKQLYVLLYVLLQLCVPLTVSITCHKCLSFGLFNINCASGKQIPVFFSYDLWTLAGLFCGGLLKFIQLLFSLPNFLCRVSTIEAKLLKVGNESFIYELG